MEIFVFWLCHWQCPPWDAEHLFLPDPTQGMIWVEGMSIALYYFLQLQVFKKNKVLFYFVFSFLLFIYLFILWDGWNIKYAGQGSDLRSICTSTSPAAMPYLDCTVCTFCLRMQSIMELAGWLAGGLPWSYFPSPGKADHFLIEGHWLHHWAWVTFCWGSCQVFQVTGHPGSLRTVWKGQQGPENCLYVWDQQVMFNSNS